MAVTDKHDAQEVMIQLPWVVPPQPAVSTHIVAETNQSRVPLDLNVSSTDTTAIWSFVIAMVVAFILGISATVIAIWYGRKSFELTQMSFETVSEDIKQSAESHREVNQRILDSQKDLKNKELQALKIEKLRDNAATYFAVGMQFNNECLTAYERVYLYRLGEAEILEIRKHIKFQYYDVSSKAHALFVYLNLSKIQCKEIKNSIFDFQSKAWEFYAELGVNQEKSIELLDLVAINFGHTQQLIIDYIEHLESTIFENS
ncbi:hypothetical protein G9F32_06960 [Acinetobacter sp. 194]|uniref:hypothetical protein n=1 Tax=Acinetobacter shaoyimingii TaxID=2715164 RepID=UPI0014093E47|nr:hypothetical protein [Acinetobacter shaoyimingii]NHB57771.1 hypothetical protein [Acinetobacter shaoyimingii]